ncbi:hypothetical protein ACIQPQ_34740 [Streptomyces sp. NPDC091281]|uniref:hypothetical protein n=1 Tax=Streptomyces sp. NPDC091281 TaxID=3365985 RepID=UPI00381A240D
MSGRTCRTTADAFQAGWNETCEHDANPAECPSCGLTDSEIARLVALLGHLANPASDDRAAA